MGEIKVRAWNEKSQKMINCSIISGDEGYETWRDFEDGIGYKNLMQFCKGQDKNKVDIYEGDIIKVPRYKSKFLLFKVVELGKYGIFLHSIPNAGGEFFHNLARRDEIEIISNIYQYENEQ